MSKEVECTWLQTSETQKCGSSKIAFREKKRVRTEPMVQTSSPLSLGQAERQHYAGNSPRSEGKYKEDPWEKGPGVIS